VVKKIYSGIRKFGNNVYRGFKNEWKYHKLAFEEIGDDLLDRWDFSKEYYKESGRKAAEGFKKFRKKTGDNAGLIIGWPAGILAIFTGYRGLSDVFEYECDLPILNRLDPGECKAYTLTLLGFAIGAFYYHSKMKRGRKEREMLIRELQSAREGQSEMYVQGMKEAGKQTRRMRDELGVLRGRISGQDKEMAELKKDSKLQLELLEKLSKQRGKGEKEKGSRD